MERMRGRRELADTSRGAGLVHPSVISSSPLLDGLDHETAPAARQTDGRNGRTNISVSVSLSIIWPTDGERQLDKGYFGPISLRTAYLVISVRRPTGGRAQPPSEAPIMASSYYQLDLHSFSWKSYSWQPEGFLTQC